MQKIIFFFTIAIAAVLAFAFTVTDKFVLSGKVIDEDGNPVPFASIKVKGSLVAVSADANGAFSIRVSEQDVIEFAAVGYSAKSINVGQQRTVTVVLAKSKASLMEVVVTSAYSLKRKRTPRDLELSYLRQLDESGTAGDEATAALQVTSRKGAIVADTVIDNMDDEEEYDREGYDYITENAFASVAGNPVSTFSVDVDAASYSNTRRMLKAGRLPAAGAVRVEEMVNYFKYDYPQPLAADPFSINTEIGKCPWNPEHRLALIGLQGKTIPVGDLPSANIVFLVDVSGSMSDENKLPLLKQSLKLLTEQLREKDKVSLCVYAGNAGLVLPPTDGTQKKKIMEAIDALESGGSTAGGAGIQLAYKVAADNFIKGGNNRVILCTDGDFNIGISSDDELERLIEKKRESGVYLTVLGFGTGNYQDAKMQKLADKGNGNHAYIDQLSEAKKVLVNEFGGTLFTIAKDVKIQVEFNPALVQGYRLIGYENRMLAKEDFDDDTKDAGEIGSGHTVTALYEIIPAGIASPFLKPAVTLKYQQPTTVVPVYGKELMTVQFRYKAPDGKESRLLTYPVADPGDKGITGASSNYRFAAAVAEFGMLLRNSAFKQQASYRNVRQLAIKAIGEDREGYRKEFLQLVNKAASLSRKVERKNKPVEEEEEALTTN